MGNLGESALAYLRAGLSVLATGTDKRPLGGSWEAYQRAPASEDAVRGWFLRADAQVALICGAVSGQLEMIDFDLKAVWFERWKIQVVEDAPGLFERLVIEESQSGGKHVCYRHEGVAEGNKKLALQPMEVRAPETVASGETYVCGVRSYRVEITPAAGGRFVYRVYFDDEKLDKGHLVKEHDGKWYAIRCPIETRGEGGYFLCAPSDRYTLLQGDFTLLPVLSESERAVLLGAARGLNKWTPPEDRSQKSEVRSQKTAPAKAGTPNDVSPMDDWAARGDVRGLLEAHGYTFAHADGTHDYFWRPGKNREGHSGSLWRASKVYKNFSSSDPYFKRSGPDEKAYSPGEIFAQLVCKGDLSAAAKELLARGFGTKRKSGAPSAGELARMDRQAGIIAEEAREHGSATRREGSDSSHHDDAQGIPIADSSEHDAAAGPGGNISHAANAEPNDSHVPRSNSGSAQENPHWPGQPAPLGPPPSGEADRPELTNFVWEERYVVDDKAVKGLSAEDEKVLIEFRVLAKRARRETFLGEEKARFEDLIRRFSAKLMPVKVALNLDAVRARAQATLHGWPMLMAQTWLFVDDSRPDGGVRLIEDGDEFKALIHDYFRPTIETGQDADRVNYVSLQTLFCSLRSTARNWGIVEKYPHFPPFRNHYYTWKPLKGYTATGEYLAGFLRFFDNIQDATSRAIFAGATLTMFSGIHYGQRPLFIHDADMPGSGKSSAAVQIGKLAGNMVMTDLSRKSEDQLLTRLLSPLGMELRGILWDNIDTIFKSALACQIITADPDISAHRMREGEGRRPANLVCFASLNAARVDTDIGRRCFITFFIKPDKPSEEIAEWLTRLTEYIEVNVQRIQADCVHVLSRPRPAIDWGDSRGETFADWTRDVLARALDHPLIQGAIMDHDKLQCREEKVTVLEVLRETQLRRDGRNKDIEEAATFMDGLCERVAAWKGLLGNNTGVLPGFVQSDVFIRSSAPPASQKVDEYGESVRKGGTDAKENMVSYWSEIFEQDLGTKTVVGQLERHILAGRMRGLRKGRDSAATMRGFILSKDVLNEWLNARKTAMAGATPMVAATSATSDT